MTKNHVHIIGGGIIGLCSAYYLRNEGYEVTVIEKGNLSNGASHGNAGMIVPSHFVPMTSPGVIAQGIKWMFNSKSPFYIKPRLDHQLALWIWRFYRSCTTKHVNNVIPVLFAFNEYSKSLYRDFAIMESFSFDYQENGLLMLYKTIQQEKEEHEMAQRSNELGLEAEILTADGLQRLEPNIQIEARGGLYFPGDAHLYPNLFIAQLAKLLIESGVRIQTSTTVDNFSTKNGIVDALKLHNGEIVKVDQILIAAGSWSAKLLRKLDINILLQDGKGYSMTKINPLIRPSIPTILSEAKVAITPMGNDLRIGGTLEISNFSPRINRKRFQGIIESVPKYYPKMNLEMPFSEDIWYGYRPCSPDGMPYIDRSQKCQNLYIATGHGMMGMSLGPATGKMISQIMTDQPTDIPRELMRLFRF